MTASTIVVDAIIANTLDTAYVDRSIAGDLGVVSRSFRPTSF